MSEFERHQAVLLLAHGSPGSPDEVPEFLLQVTGGRSLSPSAIEEIKHRYSLIGRSPLTEITLRQADLLSHKTGLPVYVGMRNWRPYISDAVKQMMADRIEHAIVICMAPHNSRTSVGLYRNTLEKYGASTLRLDFVESWHDQPQLIQAFAERLTAGRKTSAAPVIFTAHSVPERTVLDGDPYELQAKRTAELVAAEAKLQKSEWRFAFQSQGMSGGAWLGPTVESTILGLKHSGHSSVFVQPIGFLCDHVEVLYDVDMVFKQFAEKENMRLARAESLNDSPLLISALAELVRSRLPLPAITSTSSK
jgi:ferrochelatase